MGLNYDSQFPWTRADSVKFIRNRTESFQFYNPIHLLNKKLNWKQWNFKLECTTINFAHFTGIIFSFQGNWTNLGPVHINMIVIRSWSDGDWPASSNGFYFNNRARLYWTNMTSLYMHLETNYRSKIVNLINIKRWNTYKVKPNPTQNWIILGLTAEKQNLMHEWKLQSKYTDFEPFHWNVFFLLSDCQFSLQLQLTKSCPLNHESRAWQL